MKRSESHVHVILPPALTAAIDQCRIDDPDVPSRPEAIRKILQRVLLGKAKTAA
jgi:hypothetical protein